jgi:hypothetical protein
MTRRTELDATSAGPSLSGGDRILRLQHFAENNKGYSNFTLIIVTFYDPRTKVWNCLYLLVLAKELAD